MTTEETRTRLRERLEEEYGVDEAAILMDRPPGGWRDLVTKADLDQRFGAFEQRLDHKLAAEAARLDSRIDTLRFDLIATLEREIRAQTWRLVTAMATVIAAVGMFIALSRL